MKLYNSQLIQKSKNVNILNYVRKKPRVCNCPIELEILTMNSLVTFFSRRVTLFLVSNFLEASHDSSRLEFSRGEWGYFSSHIFSRRVMLFSSRLVSMPTFKTSYSPKRERKMEMFSTTSVGQWRSYNTSGSSNLVVCISHRDP